MVINNRLIVIGDQVGPFTPCKQHITFFFFFFFNDRQKERKKKKAYWHLKELHNTNTDKDK